MESGAVINIELLLDVSLGAGAVLSSTITRRGLSAWIYFNVAEVALNLHRFQALQQQLARFEAVLGEPAVWDEMDGRKAARIGIESEFTTVADVDRWPQMIEWLVSAHTRLRAALEAAGGVPSADSLEHP